jgi:hypothetical protein
MEIKKLYKYKRKLGGVSVSPIKPNAEYTEAYRIIADEGKAITLNGVDLFGCVDVDTVDGWYEVEDPRTKNELYNMFS